MRFCFVRAWAARNKRKDRLNLIIHAEVKRRDLIRADMDTDLLRSFFCRGPGVKYRIILVRSKKVRSSLATVVLLRPGGGFCLDAFTIRTEINKYLDDLQKHSL